MEYIKHWSKPATFDEVKIWSEGESRKLYNLIGFGFRNHLFISNGGIVTFYYDWGEYKKFLRMLKELITDTEFFDKLNNEYEMLVKRKGGKNLAAEMWAVLCIFNEIDENPKLARVVKHIFKTREKYHTNYYKLVRSIENKDGHRNYIYHKGKLYLQTDK